ncbi:MAG TPA: hypothetical protein VFI02_20305 [Armatimonadota bacterium]|nr:hypothetical protein [Armatimonadota bacterium]
MARMDVGNGIQPAWENMVRVLFRPFLLRKWLSLGFISLIAYGLSGGGGGFNVPGNYGGNQHPNWPGHNPWPEIMHFLPLIILGFIVLIAIGLLVSWIGSVLHFIYVDNLVRNSGAISEPWGRLRSQGTSYFLWRLAFGLIYMLMLLVVIGTPLIWAFAIARGGDTAFKVLAVVWAIMAGVPLIVAAAIVDLFVRDFVTTVMYARGVRVMEAWGIAWPIIKENAGQIALYILILIAVAIVIGIFGLVVALLCMLVVGIPVGILAAVVILAGKAMGLTWTVPVIAVAATFGCIVLVGWVYLAQCAIQPALAFRRSYALVVMGQADPSLATIGQQG